MLVVVTLRSSVDDVGLSEALVIALSLHGAVLPRYGDEPELVLGLPGLLMLEALSPRDTTRPGGRPAHPGGRHRA